MIKRQEPYTRDSINRAFLTIQALGRTTGVTVRELVSILGFRGNRTSVADSAMRWIDAASIHLPVIEIGKRHSRGIIKGQKSTAYGFLK